MAACRRAAEPISRTWRIRRPKSCASACSLDQELRVRRAHRKREPAEILAVAKGKLPEVKLLGQIRSLRQAQGREQGICRRWKRFPSSTSRKKGISSRKKYRSSEVYEFTNQYECTNLALAKFVHSVYCIRTFVLICKFVNNG